MQPQSVDRVSIMADDDHIRVGTPERERAVSLLNDAFAAGYLEMVEFEDRSGRAFAAKTRGDLRATLEHLPIADQLFADPVLHPVASPDNSAVVAATAAHPVEFAGNWETMRRKGSWSVPPNMMFTGSMSTIDLDFSSALFSTPSVQVQLQVSGSSVKIRVGTAQDIQYSHLETSGWSSVKDKAGPPLRPGGQTIVVIGSLSSMSGLVIKRA